MSPSRRPNIVVILTDDQGPWALGAAGNSEIITPNIDQLATEGIRFENFFCASPVCSPSRASLLTGRMPSAHGVHDHVRGEEFGRPDREPFLPAQLSTTPELLAKAGWQCGHVGKWHLGTAREVAPGFDFWYAHRTAAGPYFDAPVWTHGRAFDEPRYITDAITEEARRFIRMAAGDAAPFYLQVNYTAPHSPWVDQHPSEFNDMYSDCEFESCPQDEHHPWARWDGPAGEAQRNPRPSLVGYFAAVTAMDMGVGRILEELTRNEIRSDTLVIFLSDNGYNCGHHGVWGKGNGTFPVNMWENSIRVPAVACQPGRIPPGRVADDLVSACDLHPTILDWADVPMPGDPLAAGRSLKSILLDDSQSSREHVFVFDEYGGTRAVRTHRWKYVRRFGESADELYDLENDPNERENRIDDPVSVSLVTDLNLELESWFDRHTTQDFDAFGRPITGWGQNAQVWKGLPDEDTYESAT